MLASNSETSDLWRRFSFVFCFSAGVASTLISVVSHGLPVGNKKKKRIFWFSHFAVALGSIWVSYKNKNKKEKTKISAFFVLILRRFRFGSRCAGPAGFNGALLALTGLEMGFNGFFFLVVTGVLFLSLSLSLSLSRLAVGGLDSVRPGCYRT